jgi:hypothetical protein
MKISLHPIDLSKICFGLSLATTIMIALSNQARATPLFVSQQIDGLTGGLNTGLVGEYTTAGAAVNAGLITGLGFGAGIAVSGSTLFVADAVGGSLSAYTLGPSGTVVGSSVLISSGLSSPNDVVVSGSNLIVANGGILHSNNGNIQIYNTAGVLQTSVPVDGYPVGLAVSGSNIYYTSTHFILNMPPDSTVNVYNMATGVTTTLISGLNGPTGIALFGSTLFVASQGDNSHGTLPGSPPYTLTGKIGEYTTSGATINASLITGLDRPDDIKLYGSDLFVASEGHPKQGIDGTVGDYTLSSDFSTVLSSKPALISNLLNLPDGLAINSVQQLQGGTLSNPVSLSAGTTEVSASIGGSGSTDFYQFLWGGGDLKVTASVTGANSNGAYEFELLNMFGTIIAEEALTSLNNFMGEIDIAGFAYNEYVIGLVADSPNDPMIDITFNDPVASVPESSTLAIFGTGLLFLIGFGLIRRRSTTLAAWLTE